MTYTENYGFSKPELSDTANIDILNQTFDQVDATIKAEADAKDAEIKALPIKSLAGETVSTENGTTVTAGDGATIVGDLRDRVYDSYGYYPISGNVAAGKFSFAAGSGSTASGKCSFASGDRTRTDGDCSVAFGYQCESVGNYSFSSGMGNKISNSFSCAFGRYNNAFSYSHVFGYYNNAFDNQFKCGHFAKDGTDGDISGTTGDAFIIGNGTSDTRSNCFRVGYDGSVYGLSAFKTTGADYAEYFEWKDGNPNNEDRRGRLVALDGDKIRFATAEDADILGVVSSVPCIEGDVHFDDWQGKYLTDVFGQRLTQIVHIPARYEEREIIDENGEKKTENILVEEEYDAVQWVINPEYDPTKEYISRETRKEWAPVGLIGKLVVVDDGTCMPNEYCKSGENGIATKITYHTGYRVLSRIDETHIKVLVK